MVLKNAASYVAISRKELRIGLTLLTVCFLLAHLTVCRSLWRRKVSNMPHGAGAKQAGDLHRAAIRRKYQRLNSTAARGPYRPLGRRVGIHRLSGKTLSAQSQTLTAWAASRGSMSRVACDGPHFNWESGPPNWGRGCRRTVNLHLLTLRCCLIGAPSLSGTEKTRILA